MEFRIGTGLADIVDGTGSTDVIVGLGGADLITALGGGDLIDAGSGNDTVYARDKKRDTIDCGAGKNDVAIVDAGDRVKHCEQVIRRR